MHMNPFESQLERLARTLTEQYGVNVTCQGDEAWTDGSQIVLPSLPEPTDEALERMVVGFLDHEMSHVAFSDFNVAEQFAVKHAGYEGILNVVEDALIERRAMQRWPGVRANLDAMFAQIHDRIAKIAARRDTFGRFCTAVYLKLSHHSDMLGLDSEVVGYDDLLDWFPAVCDTRGAAELAEHILNRWLIEHPKTRPQGGTESGSDEAESDSDGNGQSITEDSEGPEGDQATNSEMPAPDRRSKGGDERNADQPGDEGSTAAPEPEVGKQRARNSGRGQQCTTDGAESDEPSGKASGADGNGGPDERPVGNQAFEPDDSESANRRAGQRGGLRGGSVITQVLTEAIAERVANRNMSTEYRVYTKQYDRIETVPSANEHDVRALLESHVDTVRRLRRGLANALRSAEKRWWREDQTQGVLSPRTLHRLCIDQPRLDVFRTRAMVQGRSTAVSIVLDASGSMTTRKMDVARDSLRVLLDALADLKVPTEAITFTTGREFDMHRAAQLTGEDPSEIRDRYSRFANLEIGLVKQFNEPVKTALRRLPSIHGTGLTPLGEAMHIGAYRLVPRPETRKVMLVLTDGRAGCEARDEAAVLHAKHVARKIEQAGIELVGVGIMDDSLCAILEDTIVVHELADLPAQLCKLLGRRLRRGFRHVG